MSQGSEVHRCLVTGYVAGLLRIWSQEQPHLAGLAPAEALMALHMARVEAVTIPDRLKRYSLALLAERGIRKVNGRWISGAPSSSEVMASAGIASRSADPRISGRIVRAMGDAYLDSVAAGIAEPEMLKERMLKARARERFRMRVD